MALKQISIFLENKQGRLWKSLNILKNEDIDIRALSISDTSEFGILRMIVSNPDKAKSALEEQQFAVSIADVIAIEVDDQPGGLEAALDLLNHHDVNVEYIYAFVEKKTSKALVVLRTDNNEKSIKLFKGKSFSLIEDEAYTI